MSARARRSTDSQEQSTRIRKGGGKILRRKSCYFCREKVAEIDYKNVAQLRRSISDRSKIKGRGNTGTCRKHQRQLAVAIKRAREMALLPYIGASPNPQTQGRSRRA